MKHIYVQQSKCAAREYIAIIRPPIKRQGLFHANERWFFSNWSFFLYLEKFGSPPCRPYMPFWCCGSPVRMAERLGEQLLTDVKARVKTRLRSASASMFGVFTCVFESGTLHRQGVERGRSSGPGRENGAAAGERKLQRIQREQPFVFC